MELGQTKEFIPGFLNFEYTLNLGSAYGVNSDSIGLTVSLASIITIIGIIAFIFINDKKWLIPLSIFLAGSLVIRLDNTKVNQEEIDFIASKITKNSENEIKIKVMHIILTDNKNDFSETKTQVEIYSTVEEIKNNLEPYFPNINLLNLYKKKPTTSSTVEITDEMKESFDVSDEEKAKSLKNFLVSSKKIKFHLLDQSYYCLS
ncbi:hypothetical protein FQA39_LY12903 [Lamprigera yunnana]|nr:hypothetical protein FQA39_LY12903 [Lamprigera yunnana]